MDIILLLLMSCPIEGKFVTREVSCPVPPPKMVEVWRGGKWVKEAEQPSVGGHISITPYCLRTVCQRRDDVPWVPASGEIR